MLKYFLLEEHLVKKMSPRPSVLRERECVCVYVGERDTHTRTHSHTLAQILKR